MTVMDLSHPKAIAERGEQIYRDKYKAEYEPKYFGKFVAIDVVSESAYVGDSSEEAMDLARKDAPRGLFHLVKVGSPGAFRVSYSSSDAGLERLFK